MKTDPIREIVCQTYDSVRSAFPMNEVPEDLVAVCEEVSERAGALIESLRLVGILIQEHHPQPEPEPEPGDHRAASRNAT